MSYITYLSLKQLKPEKYISYVEKLSTKEWNDKRTQIINRDKFTCNICKCQATIFNDGLMFREKNPKEIQDYKIKIANSFYDSILPEYREGKDRNSLPKALQNLIIKPEQIILQVHHKYYILDSLPWNYPDDSLETLCNTCHQELHDTSYIPIYSDITKSKRLNYRYCMTCNGSGYRPKYHYYLNGICFSCQGNRYIESL